jgi:uncharacterized membrane protein
MMRVSKSFTQGESIIEYAVEFTKRQKLIRILLAVLLGLFFVVTHNKWVFPFISWYAETAHCHKPLGYSGIAVLWYSLFVGMPLLCAFIIGVFTVPVGYKGIVQKQFPPKGMKVYKPTKIYRGWNAKLRSVSYLLVPTFFILFSIWGYFQVDQLPHEVDKGFDYSVCESQEKN